MKIWFFAFMSPLVFAIVGNASYKNRKDCKCKTEDVHIISSAIMGAVCVLAFWSFYFL